jgi:hypothetical protein
MTTLRTVSVVALVLALAAGACTSGDDAASATTALNARFDAAGVPATTAAFAATESPAEDIDGTGRAVATSGLGTGAVTSAVLQTSATGRDIIFTADITVAVTDVAVASDAAARQIAALGGFVFGQRTTGSPEPTSVFTFKVFPEDFQEALRRLGDLGELRTQNISTDDVTERIVDLESRINTAEASVQRLQELLDEAGDITTIAQLENQLLERETQLETLRGQLRTLDDQVALATIVLTLTEALSRPAVELSLSAYPGADDAGQSCPGDFGGLAVDEGSEATLCLAITNVGDTSLSDFELSAPILDLDLGDFTVVVGSIDGALVPGDSILLATEVEVERDIRPRPRVTAVPLDADGNPLAGRSVSDTDSYVLDAVDPGGVPTFGEGLAASVDFLQRIGLVAILLVGVTLPFVWIPIVAWAGWRVVRRRRHDTVDVGQPTSEEELVPTG